MRRVREYASWRAEGLNARQRVEGDSFRLLSCDCISRSSEQSKFRLYSVYLTFVESNLLPGPDSLFEDHLHLPLKVKYKSFSIFL